MKLSNIFLLSFLLLLFPSCDRNDGLQKAELESIMKSEPLDAKCLLDRLLEYSPKYKIYKNEEDLLLSIKEESKKSLLKYKENPPPNIVYFSRKNSEPICYVWTITTVTGSVGDTLSATQHDYYVVLFDDNFNIIGWVAE